MQVILLLLILTKQRFGYQLKQKKEVIKLIFEYQGSILLTAVVTAGLVMVLKFVWSELINKINRKVHVNKFLINKPYDEVWK